MSIRILIVDDEFLVRMSLKNYLNDREIDAFIAESAEEALDILKDEKVEIIIADMRLPGMDGNALILKAHEMRPLLKFLIYTGSTNYVLPSVLVDLGICDADIFRKPLNDMNVIYEAIQQLIHGVTKRDEI